MSNSTTKITYNNCGSCGKTINKEKDEWISFPIGIKTDEVELWQRYHKNCIDKDLELQNNNSDKESLN